MGTLASETLEKRSLSAQIFDYIKKMILSGEIKGGQRIPEESIAEMLDVSRTPIREALHRLEEYGLVKLKPRCHAHVVSVAPEDIPQVAVVREQLESLAASLAAQRATDDTIEMLTRLHEDCEAAVKSNDLASILDAESAFHLALARLSGNKWLYDILCRLDATIQLVRLSGVTTREHMQRAINDHVTLLSAMRERDAGKAAQILSVHAKRMTERY
jgi:DNA-binding GntR family transcriptional regulator